MLTVLRIFLNRMSPGQATALALALVGLVGVLDGLTGNELSFSIFYLLPIMLVTWYAQKGSGYLLCGISAAVWLLVDYTSGHIFTHWMIPVWNAFVRLGFFLMITYLLSELKDHLRFEESLAKTDDLTQVLNARAFKDVSGRLFHLAARHHHPIVLGYIDLDNFKGVNDRFGHSEGDHVLQTVARTLTQNVRATDVVGRLGGDEFAVLMTEINFDGAQVVFARIHEELVQDAADRDWPIGFSIGVAVFPKTPPSIDEALNIADHLMYRVKQGGKNNIIFEEQTGIEKEALLSVPAGNLPSRIE
jgi:diguanylate cyclase (GGDEF)-like protein